MPEAVIIDAVRTPIGRAFKGSLREVRPDDMGAYVLDQLLARNEAVDPASVQDVVTGCGMTQGEQAYNIGRIMVLLSEKLPDTVTGSTIARYCASSLNSIWIAANAIKAGDGDTYIAAGVESRDSGFFDREIIPVETSEGVVDKDDGPRPGTTVEKLSQLKPAFRENG